MNERDDMSYESQYIVGKHNTHVVGRVLATVRMELALNATTFKAFGFFMFQINICKYNIY